MSDELESPGWSGELEGDLGLSAGLDLSVLLGFGSNEDGSEDDSSVDLADVVESFAFDGGAGAAFESAVDLLDVGEDLNDG